MDDSPAATQTDPPRSLHDRILTEIEDRILSGEWPPGYRIPSETDLSRDYDCSRMTVNKVMTQLAQAGLILRRRRVGSVVLPQRSQNAILEIHDIKEEVLARGGWYRHDILERALRSVAPDERAGLEIADNAPVLALICLHRSDDRPFCVEERVIFLDTVPEAEPEPFADKAPGVWLLDHVPWSEAETEIGAVPATGPIAAKLAIAEGASCLSITRRTWKQGEPVTLVRFLYPGEMHRLTARFTPSQI